LSMASVFIFSDLPGNIALYVAVCGLVGWLICFSTMITFMADREKRITRFEDHGLDDRREDERR
jgi:hypothetical protein